jgi:hypothetical protein
MTVSPQKRPLARIRHRSQNIELGVPEKLQVSVIYVRK